MHPFSCSLNPVVSVHHEDKSYNPASSTMFTILMASMYARRRSIWNSIQCQSTTAWWMYSTFFWIFSEASEVSVFPLHFNITMVTGSVHSYSGLPQEMYSIVLFMYKLTFSLSSAVTCTARIYIRSCALIIVFRPKRGGYDQSLWLSSCNDSVIALLLFCGCLLMQHRR